MISGIRMRSLTVMSGVALAVGRAGYGTTYVLQPATVRKYSPNPFVFVSMPLGKRQTPGTVAFLLLILLLLQFHT